MKRMLSLVLVLALLFTLEIPVLAGDAGLQNFSPATAYVPFPMFRPMRGMLKMSRPYANMA